MPLHGRISSRRELPARWHLWSCFPGMRRKLSFPAPGFYRPAAGKRACFAFPGEPWPETAPGRQQIFRGRNTPPSGRTAGFKKGGRPACRAGRPLSHVLRESVDYLMNVIVKGIWYVYSLLEILIVYTMDRMIHTKGRIQMNSKPIKNMLRIPKNTRDTIR